MMIQLKKIENKNKLQEVMTALDCEVRDLEKNKIAWGAYLNEKLTGIIGLSHLEKDFVSIDKGPYVDETLDSDVRREILHTLLKKAESYAKQFSHTIYNTIDDSMISLLLEEGFNLLEEREIPQGYFHPCLKCEHYKKDCFPRTIKKNLK